MGESAFLASPPPSEPWGGHFYLALLGRSLGRADVDLNDLIERTLDAVILIDTEDIIRYWNQGAEAMFQYGRGEVLGRRIGFLLPSDLIRSGELEWIQARIESEGSLCSFATRRVRKDGAERWVSLTRSVLHDTSGRVIGSSAVFRDVTEERRIQEELSSARGMAIVGEMSVALAHDIKNRLAGIYSAVQLLSRNLPSGDPRRAVFADVSGEIKRLDETALDLVRFARCEPPRLRSIDLREFLEAMTGRIESRDEIRRHHIEVEAPAGLIATIDPEILGHALRNLILNAAQATAEPDRICVTVRRRGAAVEIGVSDFGSGIPDSVLAAMFQPFFTTKARGTGLGLPIARKYVEAHGGTIEAESRVGKGSCFRIHLPTACAASSREPDSTPGRPANAAT